MPAYTWVCFVCEQSNPSVTEVCQHCGANAQATGQQIEAARRSRAQPAAPLPSTSVTPAGPSVAASHKPSTLASLFCVAFGALCLFGAYQSFSNGHWPAYLPPQLDLFAVPFSLLSEKLGAYVGGVVAVLVGLIFMLGGLLSLNRRDVA